MIACAFLNVLLHIMFNQLSIILFCAEFEIQARQYTSSKRGNSQMQMMKAAQDLLQELIKHADAWPFLKPVDKKLVSK